jgi:GNAT superfamily N-acetyltransferase
VSKFTVGRAVLDEIAALPAVEVAAAQLFPSVDVPPDVANTPTPLEQFREACQAGRLWVARSEEHVAGFVIGAYKDRLPYVQELDVLPTYGRQGIGTRLMQEIIAWARHQHASHLTLTTFRHLPYNAPFYARLGFEEIPKQSLGPELRAQLQDEACRGLDPAKRVAMWRRLGF